MGEPAEDRMASLERELEKTRRDLGEVKALLRQLLSRRAPRKPPPATVPVTAEERDALRARMSK